MRSISWFSKETLRFAQGDLTDVMPLSRGTVGNGKAQKVKRSASQKTRREDIARQPRTPIGWDHQWLPMPFSNPSGALRS
jgi:hypothetical protein